MANVTGRPIAPARKLVAAVLGTIAVFVMVFGLGMSSWAIVALGVALLVLAVALGMVNVARRAARAWIAGQGQVKAVSEPPGTAAYGRAELQLVVVAPGLPVTEVLVRDPRVPVNKWPLIGDTVPLTVDVDDMRRVRVDWDQTPDRGDDGDPPPPPGYEQPDEYLDDDLLGEPEPPPWATRDRQWGRGPDEPPPPPPPATAGPDGLTSPIVVHDTPRGPVLEGQLVDQEEPPPLPRRPRQDRSEVLSDFPAAAAPGAAGDFASAPPSSAYPSAAEDSPFAPGPAAEATLLTEPGYADPDEPSPPPGPRPRSGSAGPAAAASPAASGPPTPADSPAAFASADPSADLDRTESSASPAQSSPESAPAGPPRPPRPRPSPHRPRPQASPARPGSAATATADPGPATADPGPATPETSADITPDSSGATAHPVPEQRAGGVSGSAWVSGTRAEAPPAPTQDPEIDLPLDDHPEQPGPTTAPANAPSPAAGGSSAPATAGAHAVTPQDAGTIARDDSATGPRGTAATPPLSGSAASGHEPGSAQAPTAVGVAAPPPGVAAAPPGVAAAPPRTHAVAAPTPGESAKPWADLQTGGLEPDERADDLITAYPSARPGPAGAIHGVGITVLVTDMDRAVDFYRDTLGFFEIDRGAGSAVLASGDTRLVLRTVRSVPSDIGRLVYLNLEVGDVEAVHDELTSKGVTFQHGPRAVNRGDRLELWAATFSDPDGHNIAITQWRAVR